MYKRDINPWERQEGESSKAFESFVIYRDMGAKRTFTAVADTLHKSCTLIRRWKEQWDWEKRAMAYDNSLEKEARAEAAKGIRKMIERHIKIAVDMQDKAVASLEKMGAEELTPKEIREFIKMATELERQSRVLENERTAENVDNEQSLASVIINAYREREEKNNADDSGTD